VGGWKPRVPVLLVHDPYDKTVGFSNTKAIHDDWTLQKAEALQGIVELSVGKTGAGHVGGAVIAIPTAFIWIDAAMPKSIWTMTKAMIIKAIKDAAPVGMEANTEAILTTFGLEEANPNRALLPLSRIENRGPRPYTLSYKDWLFKLGKVKLYTLSPTPLFPRQTRTPDTGGYTKFEKEMKRSSDTFELQPNTTYYLAVYPEKTGVALTLRFNGGTFAKEDRTINIKQVKNKIIGRETPALFSISSNFKKQVQMVCFDKPGSNYPFIVLP